MGCLFLLDKIKHDKSAIMFYTGLQNYEALISFFECIKQRCLKKASLKESQEKTDLQRNKFHWVIFFVLIGLNTGLFVQDLSDRFGINISFVSRMCIT